MGDESSRPKEILEKIERGEPVDYDNVVVVGDLNLSGLNLPTEHVERTEFEIEWHGLAEEMAMVESPINITNSKIRGNATLGNSIFQESVNFRGTNFSGGTADFGRAEFSGHANFMGVQFSGGNVSFRESDFGEMAQFDNVTFNGSANFSYARFSDRAYFEGSTFNDSTDFEEAQFKGNACFEGSTFHGDLDLTRTGYLRLFLRWNSIKDRGLRASDDDAYLALIRNYMNLGWFEDSNNCYFEYRNKCRNENGCVNIKRCIEKVTDTLEMFLYGYGVKPQYTLFWIMLSVLLFGTFFWRKKGIRKLVREEKLEENRSNAVEIATHLREVPLAFKDPFLFSLATFTSGFASFLQPNIDYKTDEKYARYAIIERILGTVLIALLIAAISKTYLITLLSKFSHCHPWFINYFHVLRSARTLRDKIYHTYLDENHINSPYNLIDVCKKPKLKK